jgi:hypothetical protein
MSTQSHTYWIHPMDHVRRRRWLGPVGPDPSAALHATPRFA